MTEVYLAKRPVFCYRCEKEIEPGEKMIYIEIRPGGPCVASHLHCSKEKV